MKGYLIVIDSEIEDRSQLEEISDQLAPIIENAGGKYLARGGAVSSITGAIDPDRVAVAEFDSVARARDLMVDPGVVALRNSRGAIANVNAFVVAGV